jgi:two-component system, NarL family, sensor histidine kinase DevS
MLLPLGDGDNVRGVLTVGRAAGAMPLPQAAGQLAMTFAAQAGIALELAERRQDAERLSIFEERDRIARDLHDQVIQQLYASGMKLQGTIPLITRPLVEDRLNSVVDDLDQTISDIRAVIFSLQARGKDPHRLRSSVLDVVDQMTEAHGMTCSVQLDERLDQDVPGEIGEHLLYALREALSNAARHGWASHVDVSVQVDGELSLLVRDNGTGIKENGRRSGLANLAGRAEPYGGTLVVGPASGGGTELCWQVPLPSAASALA